MSNMNLYISSGKKHFLKGNAQFVQKVIFEPYDGFFLKKIMAVGNITKAATF